MYTKTLLSQTGGCIQCHRSARAAPGTRLRTRAGALRRGAGRLHALRRRRAAAAVTAVALPLQVGQLPARCEHAHTTVD